MKTSQFAAVSAAVITVSTLVSTRSIAAQPAPTGDPSIPAGVLTAFPTVVQTGTKPTLTWNILYPSWVGGGGSGGGSGGGVGFVNPPGTLTVAQNNTYVSVQPIGTGVTTCDTTQGTTPLYADARLSLNGGARAGSESVATPGRI